MREVTKSQLVNVFEGIGIQTGAGLLVHSAIQFLGRPAGGIGLYLDTIREVIGPKGSLAVPAFNFAFARGEPFDPHETPSQGMGVFSEYVRQQPEARRTLHPMQSLAVIGRHAADIVARDSLSAFEPDSAFQRLLDLDFELLLLGADVQSVSMVHHSEQRAGVPYRFWKDFQGQVRVNGTWETRTYRMFVRDLEIDPRLDLRPIQTALQARNQWATAPLNYGKVSLCRLVDFVAAADHLLAADAWALVGNRAEAQARYELQAARRT